MPSLTKTAKNKPGVSAPAAVPRRAPEPVAPPVRRLPALIPEAVDMLNNLPADLSLQETLQRFPHVVNSLVRHWDDSRALAKAFDALITDNRNGREGFPMKVLLELANVREWRIDVLQHVGR